MKSKHTWSRVAVAALTLIGVAAVVKLSGGSGSIADSCAMFDETVAYDVRLIETIQRDGPKGTPRDALPPSVTVSGKLHLTPSGPRDENGQRLDARFTASSDDTASYSGAFSLQLDARCRIATATFDGRVPFATRRSYQRLLGALALGQRAGDEAVEHEDEYGVYRYESVAVGEKTTFSRRTLVSRANVPQDVRQDIERIDVSKFEFLGRSDAPFAAAVSVHEVLSVKVPEVTDPAIYAYTLDLRRIGSEATPASAPDVPPLFAVTKKPGQAFVGKDRPTEYVKTDAAHDDKDLETAIGRFFEKSLQSRRDAKLELIAFLKAHPEAYAELGRMITEEAFNDEDLVHVLHALAKCEEPKAQELLIDLLKNDALGPSTRLRVLFAVNEIRVPTPDMVAIVSDLAGRFLDSDDEDFMGSTAVYTIGALARQTQDLAPPLATQLRTELEGGLARADEAEERAVYVSAIANAQLSDLGDEIKGFAASESDVERNAAYEALGRMEVDGREALLAEAANTEPKVSSRRMIADAVGRVGLSSAKTVAQYAAAVNRETDRIVKAAGVTALAEAIPRVPEAKAAVLEAVRTDPNAEVLRAAGAHLGANEIARVLPGRRP